jgi:formylglycine-generating enzyme required for sulfatase activity
VAEARAKTEAERLEHERLAAEAKAKAEAEKRERERIMGKNFTNSLGMKFVGVPGTQVLMCIHETRNADYAAYTAAQSEVDRSLRSEAVGKEQHPVVQVSYEDAEDFCLWLSVKEGKIYRMPTDAEWSAAVGLLKETGRTPKEKNDNGTKDVFPWGSYWPPKTQDGNYGLREVNDGYDGIAPVMSFRPNELGIYDLGGNVWEWCQDWRDDTKDVRVLRGGAWRTDVPSFLLSSCRDFVWPGHRGGCGFRLVLVLESGG